MTEIRLPRLLDEEMRERARLHPAAARARMRLNALSTAEVTLDEEDAPIRVRDMAELYGPQGSLGIFRVSALQAAGDGLRLAEMEHGLCTLEDDVTPPGTVLQGEISDVMNTLLQWQSRPMWKLGSVESGVVLAETEADGANLLETLLAILAIDESLMIETDQRALPWVLHLKKMPAEGGCECRLNRNLDGVTVALDGSELCTRVTAVLPDGASVTRDGDTIGTWGVVHRAVTLDENQDPETEIRKYLEEHKNPGVSVELEAVALAAMTGETLDRFSLGGLCRVALPEWNTVISQRVIAMAYDDLFGEPGKVKLTLCSQTLDAAALLARLRAEQRRSGRQMFRFIRETKNGVEILAEEILLRATKTEVAELNGVLTDKISEVSVELDAANAQLRLKANQEYVDQQFSATELLLDGANARIEANALRINEVNDQISSANLAIDGANARIDAEAKRIDEVSGEVSDAKLAIDGANARIDAEAKRIDEANGEISSAKLAIDGANAAITAEVKRASEAEGELTGKLEVTTEAITAEVTRATGAEEELAGRIKITEDSITEQAGKITAQGELISGAEERIDGLNKTITDVAGDVDTLTGDLSGVRTELDGVNKTITEQAGQIKANGDLISGAQEKINGLDKSIEDIAGDIDTVTGDLSGVRTRLDGAEKKITEQAGTIDAQGKLIEGVELVLNGAEGEAGLVARMGDAESALTVASDEIKAEVKRATEKEGEMSSSIQANADAIELRVTKTDFNELGEKVTKAETRITQTEKDIALKANATTVSEIDGRLKDAEASITVNAKSIESKVSQKDFNDLEGRVDDAETNITENGKKITSAETRITQTEKDITLKADATTVDELGTTVTSVSNDLNALEGVVETKVSQETFDALGERVGTAETKITQNADAIELRATKKELEEVTASLKVESDRITSVVGDVTNLSETTGTLSTNLTNLNDFAGDLASNLAAVGNELYGHDEGGVHYEGLVTRITQTEKEITQKASADIVNALGERVGTAETKITQNANAIELRATKTELEEVSASLKVESDKITSVVGDVTNLSETTGTLSEGLTYVNEFSGQLATNLAGVGRDLYGYDDEGGEHHDGIQVELQNARTEITQTKEAITLKADADVVNKLTGRVEKAESQIEINANGITQTVKKGELISQINQSAETVQISASKVNLVGYVTTDYLESKYITAEQVNADISEYVETWADDATFGTLSVVNGNITSLSCTDITIGGNGLPDAVQESIFSKPHYHTVTESGGTVTIGGPADSPGTFNIADTQFYKDGVSAAKASVDFESFTDVQYHSDTKGYTFKITLDNGKEHNYSHNASDAYNAGANSVYIEEITWSNPAKGYVQCNITLSNGVQRGPSYQVPSSWM